MSQSASDFLSKLISVDRAEVLKLLQRGISAEIFADPYDRMLKFCLEYNTRYGAMPPYILLFETFGETATAISTDAPTEPLLALYDRVLNESVRAELVNLSIAMSEKFNDPTNDGSVLLKFFGEGLQKINAISTKSAGIVREFSKLAEELKKDYESTVNGATNGIPIPFSFIQEEMNGWQPSEITTVAAKTSVGKTWFLLMCAAAAAYGDPYLFFRHADKIPYTEQQKKAARARVLIVSFEMPVISIARRLAALMTKTSYKRLRAGRLTPAEKDSYYEALNSFSMPEDGVAIGDLIRIVGPNTCSTPDQIHAQAEDFEADLVCVDGFYYMNGPGEKRWEKVESNMREMRLHTLMTTRHYILASQLTRDANSLRTSTSDSLSFSSSIGHDSNNLLFLVQPEQQRSAKQVDIKFGKFRDGCADNPFRYEWDFDLMSFAELGEAVPMEASVSQSSY